MFDGGGQDGGYTFLTTPLCPTHDTGLGYGQRVLFSTSCCHRTQGVTLRSKNGVINDLQEEIPVGC